MKHQQLSLFAAPSTPAASPAMPDGFRYAPDVIDRAEEARSGRRVRRFAIQGIRISRLSRQAPRGLVRASLRFQQRRVAGRRADAGVCAFRCASAPPPSPGLPQTSCRTRWSLNIRRACPLVGIATGRTTMTSLGCRCFHPARSACAESRRVVAACVHAARSALDLSDARAFARRLAALHPGRRVQSATPSPSARCVLLREIGLRHTRKTSILV